MMRVPGGPICQAAANRDDLYIQTVRPDITANLFEAPHHRKIGNGICKDNFAGERKAGSNARHILLRDSYIHISSGKVGRETVAVRFDGNDIEGEVIGGENLNENSGTCDLRSAFTLRCDGGLIFRLTVGDERDCVRSTARHHLQLGRANVLSGNKANANLAYELFTVWKSADPNLFVLEQARKVYTFLD